jgi:DinB superfamily/Pentapeptide repeats (8 copies)
VIRVGQSSTAADGHEASISDLRQDHGPDSYHLRPANMLMGRATRHAAEAMRVDPMVDRRRVDGSTGSWPSVIQRQVSVRRGKLGGVARFEDQDLTDAEFRECDLTRARLIGVVMQDAVIDGLVSNLVVNGVEVTSYVEAELDRRHPVRLLIRSADPADLREAQRQLRADWTTTVARLRDMPEGSEHQRVGGEWSAVETLRHLVFVHDSWFRRCCLGSTQPFSAIGLASDFVPDQEEQGLDRAATPGLDEVLTVRDEQAAELERWLASVPAAELSAVAPVPAGPGWPPYARGKSVLECLHVVLNEEWAHHGFCVRDLDLLAGGHAGQ